MERAIPNRIGRRRLRDGSPRQEQQQQTAGEEGAGVTRPSHKPRGGASWSMMSARGTLVALTALLGLGAVGAISKDAMLSKAACFGYVWIHGVEGRGLVVGPL